jgi:hypothetical protein
MDSVCHLKLSDLFAYAPTKGIILKRVYSHVVYMLDWKYKTRVKKYKWKTHLLLV